MTTLVERHGHTIQRVNHNPTFTEDEVAASLCRDSFSFMVCEFWETIIAERLEWNWHMDYLCNELQMLAEDVFLSIPKEYDLIINIPPGTSKSTICSIMYPAWIWARMPSARIIGGSYAQQIAMDLSRKNRDVIKSEKYIRYFPYIELRSDQDTKEQFINTRGGERYAFGVGGAVFGKHAHFVLVDDPIAPQDVLSEAELRNVNHWMSESLPSRRVSKRVTPTVLIMQRLHQYDPTGARLEKTNIPVKHICLPGEISEYVNPPELAEKYIDGLLDPVRLDRVALTELYDNLGEEGYACQIDQNPVPRGGATFHTNMFKRGRPPSIFEFKAIVRYWDTAASQGKGSFSTGTKMGLDHQGRFWILDVKRKQLDSYRRNQMIEDTVREDEPITEHWTEQEPGGGGKTSAEDIVLQVAKRTGKLMRMHKVGASDGDKEKRANPLSVQVNAGNVWLAEGHWNRLFIEEFKYFPRSKYKDQVDSASGAYNVLKNPRTVVGGLPDNKLPMGSLPSR